MPHPLVGQPPAAPLADPRAAGTARRTVACHWLHLGPEEPFGASGFEADNAGERNVIAAGYYAEVLIGGAHNNVVAGNYIGTDASGRHVLGASVYGLWIFNHSIDVAGEAQFNQIGTNGDGVNDDAERNIIAGAQFISVQFGNGTSGASHNRFSGNYVGTD